MVLLGGGVGAGGGRGGTAGFGTNVLQNTCSILRQPGPGGERNEFVLVRLAV